MATTVRSADGHQAIQQQTIIILFTLCPLKKRQFNLKGFLNVKQHFLNVKERFPSAQVTNCKNLCSPGKHSLLTLECNRSMSEVLARRITFVPSHMPCQPPHLPGHVPPLGHSSSTGRRSSNLHTKTFVLNLTYFLMLFSGEFNTENDWK